MKQIVLSDFDGTIILEDSALYILEEYGVGNWRKYDDQLVKGEISLEECLSMQFSALKLPPESIMNLIDERFIFRPNFGPFVSHCEQLQIPLVIVSAGLDFVINHYLNKIRASNTFPIVSGISKNSLKGIEFKFPELSYKDSKNFKEDTVLYYQEQGYSVIYIGDGSGDFYAAKRADIVYSVKDSALSKMCSENNVKYHSFIDFQYILQKLQPPQR